MYHRGLKHILAVCPLYAQGRNFNKIGVTLWNGIVTLWNGVTLLNALVNKRILHQQSSQLCEFTFGPF